MPNVYSSKVYVSPIRLARFMVISAEQKEPPMITLSSLIEQLFLIVTLILMLGLARLAYGGQID